MKKLSAQNKEWLNMHSKKQIRLLSKRKKHSRRRNKKRVHWVEHKHSKIPYLILHAAKSFSVLDDHESTLNFFSKALEVLTGCKPNQKIYFDLSDVEVLSIDAIMYLIALIKNVKRVKMFNIVCLGNVPKNDSARRLIDQSGFYKYVSSLNHSNYNTENDKIQISQGKDADGPLAGKICDFVMRVGDKGRESTKRLFPMIMELMTNTKEHAYRVGNVVMEEKWYIFVEDQTNSIRFVFLDTGAGIPVTIRKNFAEHLSRVLIKEDAKYIASALRGEFRSETKQEYRGKGLPEVYNDSRTGRIANLVIISGRGKCIVTSDGVIHEETLSSTFVGTLFCWEYVK